MSIETARNNHCSKLCVINNTDDNFDNNLLTSSANWASAASAMELPSTLLPLHLQTAEDSSVAWKRLTSSTNTTSITSVPSPPSSHVQRAWVDQCCKVQSDSLLDAATDHVIRARLLAACSPGSGDWLEALPLSSVGLKWTMKQFE